MKVSPELVGKMVAIQLARPVYMFEYAGHAKYQGEELLACHPCMRQPGPDTQPAQPAQPAQTDLLLAAVVREVGDDSIRVALFDPDKADNGQGIEMHKTIPTGLILCIDQVGGFDVAMPVVTFQKRAPAPKSKLIL